MNSWAAMYRTSHNITIFLLTDVTGVTLGVRFLVKDGNMFDFYSQVLAILVSKVVG